MKSQNKVKGLFLILAVALVLTVTGSASADPPVFSAIIDITADPGIQICVGETVTLTADWTTNRDVTRYEWSVEGVGLGEVVITGASEGSDTIDFDTAGLQPGGYEVCFHIWHHNVNQSDRDATECVTITVTEEAFEGLSHGYWKNHAEDWVDYSPIDTLDSVFIFPTSLSVLESATLAEALYFKGGNTLEEKAQILLRNAVASLLNATHPNIDYPLTLAEVIDAVNEALVSEDSDTMLELEVILDAYNNLGADLSS